MQYWIKLKMHVRRRLLMVSALACGIIASVAPHTLQAADIDSLRVWRAPDHTRVVLDLSATVSYKYFSLANPDRLVIDLENSRLQTSLNNADLSTTPISNIRGAQRPGNNYRVVLDLSKKINPKLFLLAANQQYGERLVIDLYDQSVPKVVKTVDQNKDRRDIIIALDAGHGGEDPGALGPKKIREKKVVLEIARRIKKQFDAERGFRAVLIRDGDYYVGLQKRRELARQHKADLFVSIHADAFKDKRVSGSSVYTLSQRGASSASARFLADAENNADRIGGVDLSDKDDLLTSVLLDLSMTSTLESSASAARDILTQMKPVAKLHKNTVEHAAFAVLKSPDIPSVLIETGFISNPREAQRLASAAHQKRIANAIFNGIGRYFRDNAAEGTWVHWHRRQGQFADTTRYKIRSGDTLSGLASRYAVSLSELRRYNGLKNDTLKIGQIIKIPPRS
jgi:N-acetylmuramoyl-L-alanine amidase